MTQNISTTDFTYESSIHPGNGLAYYVYDATQMDTYVVNVGNPSIGYWVFSMASPDWSIRAAIAMGLLRNLSIRECSAW